MNQAPTVYIFFVCEVCGDYWFYWLSPATSHLNCAFGLIHQYAGEPYATRKQATQ